MEIALTFKIDNENKTVLLDICRVQILEDSIVVFKIPTNTFTKDVLDNMANIKGITMSFCAEGEYLRICFPKEYCYVNFFVSNENKIKYLTNEINKMSTELNKLIENKK